MVSLGLLAGRSPLSIAAVAIYIISHLMGLPKTAKEISIPAGVSDGTIRASYKIAFAEKERLISDEWIKKGGKIDLLPQA